MTLQRAEFSKLLQQVRARSVELCQPLEHDDYLIQSAPFVSPPKWHLAHTTWFFETLLLVPFFEGYRIYNPAFHYLFNSYYESLGERLARPHRGSVSRPVLNEVFRYRTHVDEALAALLQSELGSEARMVAEVGLHHEQQHQELLLMDIKHILFQNPERPRFLPDIGKEISVDLPLSFESFEAGVREIGFSGKGFCYDNELPRHRAFLEPFAIANRPVTNAEFLAFIEDGGYRQPALWLADGWDAVRRNGWEAPLYWQNGNRGWELYSLHGMQTLPLSEAVAHVSGYEADAFARWSGARLPTEAEWEAAVRSRPEKVLNVGHVWEWTSSAYAPYPGYQPLSGSLGEYNGKFMCNQWVLRGGCGATPANHARPTYRNYFEPEMRWHFGGIRLAKDVK